MFANDADYDDNSTKRVNKIPSLDQMTLALPFQLLEAMMMLHLSEWSGPAVCLVCAETLVERQFVFSCRTLMQIFLFAYFTFYSAHFAMYTLLLKHFVWDRKKWLA